MAQFSFLGTWQDSWDILQAILEGGDVRLVPDLKYDTCEPKWFDIVDDVLKESLRERRHLFIWGNHFSLSPPHLDMIEEGPNKGRYAIRLAAGGPGLELTLPACYRQDGLVVLGPGTLSYPTRILNQETNGWEGPSAELLAGYKDIEARMKRRLIHQRLHRRLWIGRDALQLVKCNKAKVTGFEMPNE